MENRGEGSNLFDILDVVGVIINILVELNEIQTILNIGRVSKRHYEYLHSKKLWQNFCNRVFYDKSTTRISSHMIRSIFKHTQHETEFPLLLSDLCSNDTTKQFQAVEHLRRLLNYNEDIFAFQKSVLLSPLVKLLDADDQPKLQYEVTCLLTTVTSTYRYTPRIFSIGAGATLARLLKSGSLEQQEQSAWTLNNMVFNRETINGLLNKGDINVVINVVKAYERVETVRACMSLLKNTCRFNYWCDFLQPVIPLSLDVIMRDTRDMQVCDDACMALAHLKKLGMFEQVQSRPNALQTIVGLMSLPGAVALVATISNAGVEQARAVLDAGFIAQFNSLMTANKPAPNRYYLGNLISTVSCSTPREVEHIQLLIEDGDIYLLILGHANDPTSSEHVKEKATWVIVNALDSDRSVSAYKYFLSIGALEPLCKGLNMWTDAYLDDGELDTLLGVLKRMLELEAQGEVEDIKAQIESWCQRLYELSRGHESADEILSEYFPIFVPDRSTEDEVEDYESAISYKY